MTENIQKKRFIKKYTLTDIRDFIDSVDLEWCALQVEDVKNGKVVNANIKMFNGNAVYLYLRSKGSKNRPLSTRTIITNDKFVIYTHASSIDFSNEWSEFRKQNQQKQDLLQK